MLAATLAQQRAAQAGRNTFAIGRPSILSRFRDRLSLPLIAAPMFLVSGVDLVAAACRNGVIGSFPTVDCREVEQLDGWLTEIESRLQRHSDASGKPAAPICPNLIVHRSNARLQQDLQVLLRHRPEMVITSVGSPAPVLRPLHDAGAIVFADVASIRHAERAVAAGADGLVLLTAGAGARPAGSIRSCSSVRCASYSTDRSCWRAASATATRLRAAEALGCDLAYMGTKFIATRESMADIRYKAMLVAEQRRRYSAHHRVHGPADQHAAALDCGRRSRPRRPAAARRDRHRQGHRRQRPRKPPQTLARCLERRTLDIRRDGRAVGRRAGGAHRQRSTARRPLA